MSFFLHILFYVVVVGLGFYFIHQRINGPPVSDFSMVVLEYGLIWYGLAKIFLWIFTGKI